MRLIENSTTSYLYNILKESNISTGLTDEQECDAISESLEPSIIVTDISWETDGYDANLPTSTTIPLSKLDIEDIKNTEEIEDRLNSYLSNNYGYLVNNFNYELTESVGTLKESSNIVWTSEVTEDDYDKEEIKANQYQDYLSSFTGNGPVQPKDFDEWFSGYMADDSYDMSDMIMDDYDSNVGPMIDKQVNGAIFITGNYNSNYPDFKKSGPGGKIVKDSEDLINWLSNEDRVDITNNEGDQLGVAAYDHDGSIGGLLFTLPDDPHKVLEIAMSTDYYDENDYEDNNGIIDDFMYDLSQGNVSMRDIKKPELLVPIKNGFLINESVEPSWMKDDNTKKEFRNFIDSQLKDGAIDDPEHIKTLSNEEYNDLIDNTYMKDKDMIKGFEEVKGLNESVKTKKKDNKRILMQQGNVSCIEEGSKYKVFENEAENLKEYDNKDEAMKDALNRCGVNPDNSLKEKE